MTEVHESRTQSFWETKFHSAEKSIEFIQIEHGQTLKYLHEQINELQKKCCDLSFKLSLHATSELEKEEFDKLQIQFDTKVKQKEDLISEQQNLLNERNKIINQLQNELHMLEKKADSDSKTKDDIIRQLKLQVDQQSIKIAELSFQVYTMNQKKFESSSAHQLGTDFNEKQTKLPNKPLILPSSSKRIDNHFRQILLAKKTNETKQYIQIVNDKPVNIMNRRDSYSSGVSERPSKLQPIKALPFEELRKTIKPLPDPMPFLMQNIVVTSSNHQLLAKPKLNALPPIKSATKLNELAVDSPHKHNSFLNQLSDIHKN